ncbi:MAG: extensin family protein [Rhizobiaceae bacterium]
MSASEARPAVMPPEEAACRARLGAAGVTFGEEEDAFSDSMGCDLPWPVTVSGLGGGIALSPPATVNCPTAETLVTFMRGTAAPDARKTFGSELVEVRQASGYVCRPRNGSEKLSEHAFGNAIDIASFRLADGTEIMVDATREPDRSAFLSRLREAACGPFKTVLGPGSDADHATHFHLDLAERRGGSVFCQ